MISELDLWAPPRGLSGAPHVEGFLNLDQDHPKGFPMIFRKRRPSTATPLPRTRRRSPPTPQTPVDDDLDRRRNTGLSKEHKTDVPDDSSTEPGEPLLHSGSGIRGVAAPRSRPETSSSQMHAHAMPPHSFCLVLGHAISPRNRHNHHADDDAKPDESTRPPQALPL